MKNTDRNKIGKYTYALPNYYITALALKSCLQKSPRIEEKRILYVRIFSEFMCCTENLVTMVSVIRQHGKIRGFWEKLVKADPDNARIKVLWEEIQKYKNKEIAYLTDVLNFKIPKQSLKLESDKYINIYKGIYGCFANITKRSYKDKSGLLKKCYNKIKHGFFIDVTSDRIIFYISSGRGIRKISFTYKEDETDRFIGSIKAITDTLMNLCLLISMGYN